MGCVELMELERISTLFELKLIEEELKNTKQ